MWSVPWGFVSSADGVCIGTGPCERYLCACRGTPVAFMFLVYIPIKYSPRAYGTQMNIEKITGMQQIFYHLGRSDLVCSLSVAMLYLHVVVSCLFYWPQTDTITCRLVRVPAAIFAYATRCSLTPLFQVCVRRDTWYGVVHNLLLILVRCRLGIWCGACFCCCTLII